MKTLEEYCLELIADLEAITAKAAAFKLGGGDEQIGNGLLAVSQNAVKMLHAELGRLVTVNYSAELSAAIAAKKG